jgi:hypothetical protein
MEIKDIKEKAKELEGNIWKLIYDFERETETSVTDINVVRISRADSRESAFYQINADVKLW